MYIYFICFNVLQNMATLTNSNATFILQMPLNNKVKQIIKKMSYNIFCKGL